MGRLMKILLPLLLLFSVVEAGTPIGFTKWYNGGRSYSQQFGGTVRNYQSGQTWAQINNNWKFNGDSVYTDESVLKAKVDTATGASSITLNWGGQDYTVSQKLGGIGWLKISTRGRQWIDSTMDFSNVSVDSNIIKWTGVSPAVDCWVKKQNGQVELGVFFKPAFLDSAVSLYNQRPDSLDIALANVMVYTLSGNIDNADSGMGELTWRQLKSFGEYTFSLTDQRLRYPGSDTLQAIPVKQFWRKRNDFLFCIEYVMMSQVKRVHELYPSNVIWHNATTKIEGTTNVEDTEIYGDFSTNGFGGRVQLRTDNFVSSFAVYSLIRAKNLSTELPAGATITDAICSLFVYDHRSSSGDVSAYRVFKPWVEGTDDNVACTDGCEWGEWRCSDAQAFGTAGVACANDDGVDNSQNGTCDATGRDRKSTAESTVSQSATSNVWYGWDISNALAQGWYDGTINEEGIILETTSGGNDALYRSTEAAQTEKPFFVFTYTVSVSQKVMLRK